MITIRNPMQCQSLTVEAGEALVVGQLVKLVQGTAAGDPPKVVSPLAADYKDATVQKGIVYFVPDDDEAVDYIVDPNTKALTVNTGTDGVTAIASGKLCTFWFDKPIVGITADGISSEAGVALTMATREGSKIAINTGDHLFDDYDAADTDVSDTFMGTVIATDGAELTIYLSAL